MAYLEHEISINWTNHTPNWTPNTMGYTANQLPLPKIFFALQLIYVQNKTSNKVT